MALASDDLVVRGGASIGSGGNSVGGIAAATALHPSGVIGVSVEARPGASLYELCVAIPHNHVGVTTLGEIRAAGGDVTTTSGRSPNHATLIGLTPEQAYELLTPTTLNPVPPEARRKRW